MSRKKPSDPFRTVRHRFDRWRKTRTPGTKIPAHLWRSAASLARKHGISKTVVALGLNHTALKQRMESAASAAERAGERVHNSEFVEIPFPMPVVSECLVDIEEDGGSKLRVQLKGSAIAQVEAVIRSIWRSEA